MTDKDKMRITMQLGVGVPLKDIRIGNMGYANGWYPPFGDESWMNGGLQRHILNMCHEQGIRFASESNRWSCDTHYYNSEYNISYDVDSSG